MRVSVDAHLCSGQGRCYVVSPELFSSDDDGYCAERGKEWEVPAGMESRGGWHVNSDPGERNRRSVYVFVRRNTRYPSTKARLSAVLIHC